MIANEKNISDLLNNGENERLEFKNSFDKEVVETTTQKTKTRELILELLQNSPQMTRSEIASALLKSENTIKEHLAKLKMDGRLKRVGSDRSGKWLVISE